MSPDAMFVNIGERCNVAGSRRFCNLIKKGNYEVHLFLNRIITYSRAALICLYVSS